MSNPALAIDVDRHTDSGGGTTDAGRSGASGGSGHQTAPFEWKRPIGLLDVKTAIGLDDEPAVPTALAPQIVASAGTASGTGSRAGSTRASPKHATASPGTAPFGTTANAASPQRTRPPVLTPGASTDSRDEDSDSAATATSSRRAAAAPAGIDMKQPAGGAGPSGSPRIVAVGANADTKTKPTTTAATTSSASPSSPAPPAVMDKASTNALRRAVDDWTADFDRAKAARCFQLTTGGLYDFTMCVFHIVVTAAHLVILAHFDLVGATVFVKLATTFLVLTYIAYALVFAYKFTPNGNVRAGVLLSCVGLVVAPVMPILVLLAYRLPAEWTLLERMGVTPLNQHSEDKNRVNIRHVGFIYEAVLGSLPFSILLLIQLSLSPEANNVNRTLQYCHMFCICSVAIRGHLFLSSYLALLHWPTFILYVLCFFADIINVYAIYTWFLFVDRIPDRDYHFEMLLPSDVKLPLWGVLWFWKIMLLTLLVLLTGAGTIIVQTLNGCFSSRRRYGLITQFCFFITSLILLIPALILLEVVKFSLLFTVVCADRDRQLDAMQPFVRKIVAFFRRGSPAELRTKVWITNRFLARVFLTKQKREQFKHTMSNRHRAALYSQAPAAIAKARAMLSLDPRNFRLEDMLEANHFSMKHVAADSAQKIAQFFQLVGSSKPVAGTAAAATDAGNAAGSRKNTAERVGQIFHRVVLAIGAPIYVSGLVYTVLLPFLALGAVTWELASILQSLTSVLYLVTILIILVLSPYAYQFKKHVAYIQVYPTGLTGPIREEWVREIESIYHSRAVRTATYEQLTAPQQRRSDDGDSSDRATALTTVTVTPSSHGTSAVRAAPAVAWGVSLPAEIAAIVLEYLPAFDEHRRHQLRSRDSLHRELFRPDPAEVATRALAVAYNERVSGQIKAIQSGELQLVDDAEYTPEPSSCGNNSTDNNKRTILLVPGSAAAAAGGLSAAVAISAGTSRSASARNSLHALSAALPPAATTTAMIGSGTLLIHPPRRMPSAPAMSCTTAVVVPPTVAMLPVAPRYIVSTLPAMMGDRSRSASVRAIPATNAGAAERASTSGSGSTDPGSSDNKAVTRSTNSNHSSSDEHHAAASQLPNNSLPPTHPHLPTASAITAASGGAPAHYTDFDYADSTPIASRTPSVSIVGRPHDMPVMVAGAAINIAFAPPLLIHPSLATAATQPQAQSQSPAHSAPVSAGTPTGGDSARRHFDDRSQPQHHPARGERDSDEHKCDVIAATLAAAAAAREASREASPQSTPITTAAAAQVVVTTDASAAAGSSVSGSSIVIEMP